MAPAQDDANAQQVRTTLGLDGTSPRSRRRFWPFVLVGVGVLALTPIVFGPKRRPGGAGRYVTADVTRGDLEVTITATGTVETLHTIEVGSEVTGRVLRVSADANDHVKKGQVLALVDPEQLRAALNQGQAQVDAGEAAVRQARATQDESHAAAERIRKEAAEGLASKKDLEGAVAAENRGVASTESAVANVALAKATLAAARSKLERSTVYSPVDGIVLSRSVEVGQTITAGFTTPVMFKIAEDLSQMRLEVDIDEADVGRAKEGQHATFVVEAYPDHPFPSVLTSLRFNPTTSSNVVTYKAILSVDNRALLLRPGMTATATIVTETKPNVVLVPNAALRFAPPKRGGPGAPAEEATSTPAKGERGVYVVDKDELRRIPVKSGATDGNHTELLGDALTVGSKVVVDLESGAP